MTRIMSVILDLLWLIAFALAMVLFALQAHASGGEFVVDKMEVPPRQTATFYDHGTKWFYEWYPRMFIVLVRDPDGDPELEGTDQEWCLVKFVSQDEFENIEPGQWHYFEPQ